jgi:hypothetical protein
MRRLLGLIRRREVAAGDLSIGDWTPIPPGCQAGATDLATWLQEGEPPAPPPPPARPSWIDVLKSFGEHLTDAELRIIRQQLG